MKALSCRVLLSCLALAGAAPPCQAEIHKCTVAGKIVYTDQACGDGHEDSLELPALNGTEATKASYTGSLWLKDHYGYQRAVEAGLQENLPVLIYVYTDWCGYCRKLEKNYFSHFAIKSTLQNVIKVRINPEHSRSDEALFKSLGGTGYPTLLLKAPGGALQRIEDPFLRLPDGRRGNLSPDAFNQYLLKILKPHLKAEP